MNVVVHYPDFAMTRRAAPQAFRFSGTSLVIGGGRGGEVKIWEAPQWREFVDLWIRGTDAAEIYRQYTARGFTIEQLRQMRALIMGNDHILPPIDRALFVLSGLGCRADRAVGGFMIFGRPARAIDVVDAANRILISLALPQIRYPNVSASGV